jgi:hypothetical protein
VRNLDRATALLLERTPAVILAGLLLPLALAACGHSPPTAFFTLDPIAPASPPTASAIAPVQLAAVHIPSALDRPELVTQTGPNRVQVNDLDHWAAPLGEMMRRTLAQDLMARLPAGSVVPPGAPKPPGARALVVTVLQLTSGAGGKVDMQANWSLLPEGLSNASLSRNVELSASSGAGPDGEAAGMSRILADLAGRIAADLARS